MDGALKFELIGRANRSNTFQKGLVNCCFAFGCLWFTLIRQSRITTLVAKIYEVRKDLKKPYHPQKYLSKKKKQSKNTNSN
mgnify:CR=1 FL=1